MRAAIAAAQAKPQPQSGASLVVAATLTNRSNKIGDVGCAHTRLQGLRLVSYILGGSGVSCRNTAESNRKRVANVMRVCLSSGSKVGLVAGILGIAYANVARADGGLYSGTQGAHATGRGGAFTAKADDISAVMLNPAGLGHIKGTLIHVGNRFSYNSQEYTRAPTIDYGSPDSSGGFPIHTFARVRNSRPLQAIDPMAGVASHLGLESWVFALAVQAPPGIARQSFPVDGGQRYLMVDYEALMLNYSLSAAWKANDKFGLGVSAQWIHVPRLNYSLIINANPFIGGANPVSSNLDMLASVSGSAPFTFNTVLGAWYRPVPAIELGIAGQVVPTSIRAKGRLNVTPVSSSADDTVELTIDGDPANDVRLTIPLPLMGRAGIRYRHLLPTTEELFDIELDLVYESWSRVNHFTVATRKLQATYLGQKSVLEDIYVEKRWHDTIGVHLGGDYAVIPSVLAIRGGVFYQNPLADSAYANVDFMTGAQFGGAVGATVAWGHQQLALAYEYRQLRTVALNEAQSRVYQTAPLSQCKPPYTDRSRCSSYYLGLPGPPVNAGSYDARNHLLAVDWLYHF